MDITRLLSRASSGSTSFCFVNSVDHLGLLTSSKLMPTHIASAQVRQGSGLVCLEHCDYRMTHMSESSGSCSRSLFLAGGAGLRRRWLDHLNSGLEQVPFAPPLSLPSPSDCPSICKYNTSYRLVSSTVQRYREQLDSPAVQRAANNETGAVDNPAPIPPGADNTNCLTAPHYQD